MIYPGNRPNKKHMRRSTSSWSTNDSNIIILIKHPAARQKKWPICLYDIHAVYISNVVGLTNTTVGWSIISSSWWPSIKARIGLHIMSLKGPFIPDTVGPSGYRYKKAPLSLTNARDATACRKFLQFDVLITLSLSDNTGLSSFIYPLLCPKSAKSREILWKFNVIEFKVIQGHRSWCQSKAHMYFPISH